MTIYRGYDIVPVKDGFAAIDNSTLTGKDDEPDILARGATEEAVMDAIDRWKRQGK